MARASRPAGRLSSARPIPTIGRRGFGALGARKTRRGESLTTRSKFGEASSGRDGAAGEIDVGGCSRGALATVGSARKRKLRGTRAGGTCDEDEEGAPRGEHQRQEAPKGADNGAAGGLAGDGTCGGEERMRGLNWWGG
jgi:hypothetical protein